MLFLLLSFPTAIFCATATITIIATNDIHGSAFPTVLSKTDGSTTYNYGGLEFMANMIRTLQMENQGNVLYLDSGDQFQGGI